MEESVFEYLSLSDLAFLLCQLDIKMMDTNEVRSTIDTINKLRETRNRVAHPSRSLVCSQSDVAKLRDYLDLIAEVETQLALIRSSINLPVD